ncbi:hypothetical protein PR202_gb28790 [Eleusine coracana subsp. coracana]|uniref:Uncharacterized protein n=1 Tax=Eleusine coracana subsp. coracana TaxID=191504 RepID=A0AAV5FVD8_ELECO|nr:hypothetical protein PR202_gb28790 [Eleusine coracana subsp. coracana]
MGEERKGGEEDAAAAARAADQARELQDAAAALLTRDAGGGGGAAPTRRRAPGGAPAASQSGRGGSRRQRQESRDHCVILRACLPIDRHNVHGFACVDVAVVLAVLAQVEEDLDRATCLISDGDIASLLPSKTHGNLGYFELDLVFFLKMFLGPVNLRATRKEVQLKVKEEYNSYRDRTALLFLGFPVILLCLRSWLWNGCFPALPVQLYQAWLLFLYTTLALRENILRVNGSDIRAW